MLQFTENDRVSAQRNQNSPWENAVVVDVDAMDVDLPYRVQFNNGSHRWVRPINIRPRVSSTPQLQYRSKTSGMDGLSPWRDILSAYADEKGSVAKFDYRNSSIRLEYVEIRIKPEFVPGYYQCVDDSDRYTKGEVVQFAHHGELDDTRAEWIRVNVTPAE